MNPILRNILAVIAGCLFGGFINMGIIMMSSSIIPPPEGADITTVEGLKASMHLFTPINFLMPWLAHALGTFAGALLTAYIAVKHQMKLGLLVGILFMAGGITDIMLLPSPLWFSITDAVFAYIPMAWLAVKISGKGKH